MIPVSKWRWFGHAVHFCAASDCRFHMTTAIGKYVVSSVGDYRPRTRGEPAETAQPIGYDYTYETMVFVSEDFCKLKGCKCGLPIVDGNSIDFNPANSAADATSNHMAMCAKYARTR